MIRKVVSIGFYQERPFSFHFVHFAGIYFRSRINLSICNRRKIPKQENPVAVESASAY